MRGIPLGVALVAAALYLLRLGAAPFVDPPEGFHAEIAREMLRLGDWITPHVNGVRYFDKPPVLYWLMAGSFAAVGVSETAARVWSALASVGIAAVTARLGFLLGGARIGLLAGLMVIANLGMYLYGRLVKPDVVFILCIVLAYAGFAVAYKGAGRWGLVVFYASLGAATITKDVLGAIGPLAVVALFFFLTREQPISPWAPWWGVLLLLAIAVPWYAAVEAQNRGFLWYTIVDNHLLNFTRQRVFPDEDVPLGALPFLGVTFLAFLPWSLAAPWAVARALRRPWEDATARLWVLIALWPIVVIGFFALSPFKLPHYGLPAFPALALLVARLWDESIEAAPGSLRPRALIVPVAVTFALAALAFGLAAADRLPLPAGALTNVDVATRNLAARGQVSAGAPLEAYVPVLRTCAIIFAAGTLVLGWAAWRRRPAAGAWAAVAVTLAFLPAAGDGMAQFARSRSARTVTEALVLRLKPGDQVVHEGPLENTGSLLLALDRPVTVVNGLQSNLAFGATFPEGRDRFWDGPRLAREWTKPGRRFLVTGVAPERSVVRTLPPAAVRLVARGGGRWLYTNVEN
ncbi:MAG TPA: glycosyltransferase family 39 protein [Methylomirabilota bacterium]|nr:glycosyltransferase family 39 protein [Methylomirabilota bacterium]